ncbi:N-methyl-L-tryptophan oxidase [Halostreptopolyspora alba]|uniref:N-methyl-L-tryptophan oxidase n=1 Tax=Halostreptopolyspora alba TaxID=2487137 RepID=UPI00269690A3
MATTYDVAVIGLGSMGSAAAAHLASRGRRVLGLDRSGPAADRGAGTGDARVIRHTYFERPDYVPLLRRSYELWDSLDREPGNSGLIIPTGGLMLGRPHSHTVTASRASAERWGLPYEVLGATEIRRRFPAFTPGPDEVGVFEPSAGLVRPEATVAAHLRLAARDGADLRFAEPVTRWEALSGGEGVRVVTDGASYTADRLVVCPGAWAPELLPGLGVPLTVERQVRYWLEPRDGLGPFLPGRHPVFVWEDRERVRMYGFPAVDGPRGGVKTGFFRRGRPCTPDSIDREVRPAEIAEMSGYLATRLPELPGRFRSATTALRTSTPDEHFVLATHPEHAQVTVAYGFSGYGAMLAPAVGEILADLATSGSTAHPIALFDPRRELPLPVGAVPHETGAS